MNTIFTIGYEGAAIGPFLENLADAGISHVIDIRDVPASRKRGFSKSILASALAERGISYTHLKPLGDPKPGREAMRSGDFKTFLSIYNNHVSQPAAQASLKDAIAIATKEPAVLLCYEKEPEHCHRNVVAKMMKKLASLAIHHLSVTEGREGESRERYGTETATVYAVSGD